MDASVAMRKAGAPRAGIAERIWDAARAEFSKRGYHGARVQGIARGAACNVALIYRHWASKRALYLDILRAVWLGSANEIARLVQSGPGGAAVVVAAYLDAMMKDPMGAQILIREYLDGAPFLSQLTQTDPALLEPVRRAAAALAAGDASDLDPVLTVVTVGGLAALVASSREAARPFVQEPIAPEAWRQHVLELLVNGLRPARPASVPGTPGGTPSNGAAV
ncbi:TetR/AcrR family transcriptional regulator [Anaeromyxobacter sp. Fw109-5]|uniref:TetR/AcrR family transcriptional regulator n=1 Tax=Anaeromyxobacter sp. (strain Fw109-5) TaxID=404589 RepID=UPI0000ED77E5|nr:TetR/AcrR family transcriptional regulator [Anaeromyxobacter sp. Fw109-5]ABS24362.1 transcriptional regulator, TetR family [Anaeromyxobacter sp. Fw109-5]